MSQPIRDNVLESISQIDGQIVIKVFGDDPASLRTTADDVLRAVSHVRGVSRAFIDRAGEVPQLQIEVDRGRAARYGLNVADVEDVVETALGGKVGDGDLGGRPPLSASRCGCASSDRQRRRRRSPTCWSTRRRVHACRWRTSPTCPSGAAA